jgi:hypothetical protein
MVKLPEDEDTPAKRVDKIFRSIERQTEDFERHESDSINYTEFVGISKKDKTILSALSLYDSLV